MTDLRTNQPTDRPTRRGGVIEKVTLPIRLISELKIKGTFSRKRIYSVSLQFLTEKQVCKLYDESIRQCGYNMLNGGLIPGIILAEGCRVIFGWSKYSGKINKSLFKNKPSNQKNEL